jgi:hypothetical protein
MARKRNEVSEELLSPLGREVKEACLQESWRLRELKA